MKKKETIITVATVAAVSAFATFLYKKKKSGELQTWLENWKSSLLNKNNQEEIVGTFDPEERTYIPLEYTKSKK